MPSWRQWSIIGLVNLAFWSVCILVPFRTFSHRQATDFEDIILTKAANTADDIHLSYGIRKISGLSFITDEIYGTFFQRIFFRGKLRKRTTSAWGKVLGAPSFPARFVVSDDGRRYARITGNPLNSYQTVLIQQFAERRAMVEKEGAPCKDDDCLCLGFADGTSGRLLGGGIYRQYRDGRLEYEMAENLEVTHYRHDANGVPYKEKW